MGVGQHIRRAAAARPDVEGKLPRWTRLGPALLLLAALSAPASAQSDAVGVNYSDAMRSAYEGRETLPRFHRLARCIVERARSASGRLMEAIPDSREEDRVLLGSIRSRLDQCAQTGAAVSDVLLRGLIAEALYETLFSRPVEAAVPPAVVDAFDWPAGHPTAGSLAPVYELGRCVAADHAPLLHRLLETDPYSAEETLRFAELGPLLGPCLVAGTNLTANRETLRAVLAEALYKWSRAQTGDSAPNARDGPG